MEDTRRGERERGAITRRRKGGGGGGGRNRKVVTPLEK